MCPKRDGFNIKVSIWTQGKCVKGVSHFCRPKSLEETRDLFRKAMWGIAAGMFKYTSNGEYFHFQVYAENLIFEAGPDPFDPSLPGGECLLEGLSTFKWTTVRHVKEEA